MERHTADFYREHMKPPSPTASLVLPADGRAVPLRLRRPVRLHAIGGRAWITRVGCPDDHWIEAGQTLELAPSRWFGWRLMVSGDGASAVTLKAEPLA